MSNSQMDLFSTPNTSDNASPSSLNERAQPLPGATPFSIPEKLYDHLLEAGLSAGRIQLANQLVCLEPTLGDGDRRALFVATVVGLKAQAQGSTFVPLPSRSDFIASQLEQLIPELLIDRDDRWAPRELVDKLNRLLDGKDLQLVGSRGDYKPLIADDGRLYHQRMMLHETRLVEAIARRLERPERRRKQPSLQAAFDELRQRQPLTASGEPMELNDEQYRAVSKALHQPLTLITGGPGTGKTSIVVSVLRMLVRLDLSPHQIALAAPTGKAAHRMAESIHDQLSHITQLGTADQAIRDELQDPKTLHRLLGYSPRRDQFHHHRENPLPHKMVIVDEASMIDLFLMEQLFGAVAIDAQLVLLGDADQLPSVDTGAVLRDLIPDPDDASAPTRQSALRLTKSYRMRADDPAGRRILTFAQSIRDFDDDPTLTNATPVEDLDDMDASFEGIHRWQPPTGTDPENPAMQAFVDWWFDAVVLGGDEGRWKRRFNRVHRCDAQGRLTDASRTQVRQVIDHYERARILTLTRVFPTGSKALNAAFHRATARLGRDRLEHQYAFHPGDPVMMLRNDYDRDLFNGDQGVVILCEQRDEYDQLDPRPMAVFARSDQIIAYPLAELSAHIEHAFAMTVHKAQGSEFERVALVLPGEPIPLLNRELLYTGLTRASSGVLLVGRQQLLAQGAANRSERFSAVADKLRRA